MVVDGIFVEKVHLSRLNTLDVCLLFMRGTHVFLSKRNNEVLGLTFRMTLIPLT